MKLFCQNMFKDKVLKEHLRWLHILHKKPKQAGYQLSRCEFE